MRGFGRDGCIAGAAIEPRCASRSNSQRSRSKARSFLRRWPSSRRWRAAGRGDAQATELGNVASTFTYQEPGAFASSLRAAGRSGGCRRGRRDRRDRRAGSRRGLPRPRRRPRRRPRYAKRSRRRLAAGALASKLEHRLAGRRERAPHVSRHPLAGDIDQHRERRGVGLWSRV